MVVKNLVIVTNRGIKEVKFVHKNVQFTIEEQILKVYRVNGFPLTNLPQREPIAGYRMWTSYHIVDDVNDVPEGTSARQYNLGEVVPDKPDPRDI